MAYVADVADVADVANVADVAYVAYVADVADVADVAVARPDSSASKIFLGLASDINLFFLILLL